MPEPCMHNTYVIIRHHIGITQATSVRITSIFSRVHKRRD